ncbi:LTA synthase family protein [Georgenia muralis]
MFLKTERAARRPGRRSTARRLGLAALQLALTIVVAVVITIGLETVHALNDPWVPTAERLTGLPTTLVLLGTFLVWSFVVLLFSLTGRLWAAAGIALAVATVIAFADYQKMLQRTEPVYPSDTIYLLQPGFLVETVGPTVAAALALAAIALPVLAWALVRLVRRRRPRPEPLLARRPAYALRAVAGVLSALVLVSAAGFNQPGNPVREIYEDAGTTWAPWNQTENYARNGFVTGTLYNVPAPAMERPEGYDAARMTEIAEKYRAVAAQTNTTRDPAALAETNVVIVLAETFTDPLNLDGVEVGLDPLPYTRSLMASTTSGTMLSSGFGGGTANVEFEVLTGMALHNFQAQVHTPFQALVPHRSEFPSFLWSLGAPDRATLAIHPYLASFYRRDDAYPVLGFERAEFRDDMTHTDTIDRDPHVSDAATFEELLDELRASDEPLLANVVTMQNHGPLSGKYDDPVDVVGPIDDARTERLGNYVRGLAHSDDALAGLVADLEALDERTVVLLYGDHLPSSWPEAVLDLNDERTRYETPWFVWANFPTEKVETPPVLGPNFLVNQMLATVGAPVTPYNALLDELSREVPAMERTMMLDPRGEEITEADLSARGQELLEDYRLVQYDMVVGEGHVAREMLEVPAGG